MYGQRKRDETEKVILLDGLYVQEDETDKDIFVSSIFKITKLKFK